MAFTFLIKLWNDRRGTSALALMIAMVPLLGVFSLGTEYGSWHVIRRHAQSAADAAAIAGATALVVNDPTGAKLAGQAFANSNGFATGDGCLSTSTTGQNVCIEVTPSGTGLTGTKVTAVVKQFERPSPFSKLFLPPSVEISGTAVATIQDNLGGYCALGLENLAISGSSSLNGKCSLASNGTFNPPPPGQNPFLGGPTGWTVSAVNNGCTGNANGCNLSGVVQSYNYSAHPVILPPALKLLMNEPPVDPPVVPPEPTGNISNKCTTVLGQALTPSQTWQDYTCISGGTLAPGLYMFRQLDVTGSVSGTGVNIIIGSGGLGGSGDLTLTAGNGGGLSAMNGVLIFDQEVTKKNETIKYTGQFVGNFNGAIYFPYAHLTFRGGSGLAGCMVVVAKDLDYGGNSSMDTSGCSASILSSIVPQAQVVVLTN